MKQATLIRPRHRPRRSTAAEAAAASNMCPKRHWLVNKATGAGSGGSRGSGSGAAARSRRSLDQIVEVLVALILVNCLATAAAALITPPDSLESLSLGSYTSGDSSADSSEDDVTGFYRSPHRLEGYPQMQQLQQQQQQRGQNFKISPKPCSFGRVEGTCMFVWECIKSEGRHVGMCVDSFMFGSCCTHNYTDNIVLPQTAFSYTRPTKPLTLRPRPPAPYKPMISGMTTIERPHGAGTIVIRPSGPHHQGTLARPHPPPYQSKPTTASDLQSSASHPSSSSSSSSGSSSSPNSIWHTSTQQQQHQQNQQNHWQMTTEPSFITKPRPTGWTKPGIVNLPMPARPSKPSKPTKKPIVYERPPPPPPPSPSTTSTTSLIWPGQTQPHRPTRPQLSPGTSLAASSSAVWPSTSTSTSTTSTSTSTTTTTTTRRTTTPATTTTTRRTPASKPTKPYQRPTTSILGSSTSSSSSSSTTTAHPSKTPTTIGSTSGIVTSSSSQRPTHRPPGLATSGIETNEITDSSSMDSGALGHVKTISAARSECGVPTLARPETRIVGGKSAAFGRWPWQVSVRRTSFFGFSSTHRCGGALINENWIATAGHCVDDLLISQIRIRVGEYDFSHVQEQLPYIERGVAKKVVHPKYSFLTYEYDLALVKLEQPLEFAPHVSPICLPETESLLIGMNATVTGWGRLSEGGTLPSVLQEVSVPIVSNDNCKSMFMRAGRQEFIPDIFLCAGYETGGQDSCQGDSGGPLQAKSQDGRFFLAGIISWGIGCAEANLPGVCTRISKFTPWILEHVR
ncbi:serine proteinase stubble [Drosophila serrata]|uniref:serine proteinase stubble n=1 Tax=Drosophila serrata TaxID=7274 RepID=UPI000A1CFAB0|nr:serine proteinase stubble [Drosophila serrata]